LQPIGGVGDPHRQVDCRGRRQADPEMIAGGLKLDHYGVELGMDAHARRGLGETIVEGFGER
jgi:hypothetical protein